MNITDAVGHKLQLAIDDADAKGAAVAAEFLRHEAMDLLREVHRRHASPPLPPPKNTDRLPYAP